MSCIPTGPPLAPPSHPNARRRCCLDHPPPPRPSLAPKREWIGRLPSSSSHPNTTCHFNSSPPSLLSLQTVRWRGIQKTVEVGYGVDGQCGVAGPLRYVNFVFSFFLFTHPPHQIYSEDLRRPPAPAPATPVPPQNKWEGTPSLARPLPSQPPLPLNKHRDNTVNNEHRCECT